MCVLVIVDKIFVNVYYYLIRWLINMFGFMIKNFWNNKFLRYIKSMIFIMIFSVIGYYCFDLVLVIDLLVIGR